MTHVCVNKLAIIGTDNGFLPGRCQGSIWNDAGILLIRFIGAHFNEILSEIHTFSFRKMDLKMSSVKWRQFCLGLDMLNPGLVYVTCTWYEVDEWTKKRYNWVKWWLDVWRHQPLPEPVLTNHRLVLVAFTWGPFHINCQICLSLIWVWKLQI